MWDQHNLQTCRSMLSAVHDLQAHPHSWHMWLLEAAAGVVAEEAAAAGAGERRRGSSLGRSRRRREPLFAPLVQGCRTLASAPAMASAPLSVLASAQPPV